MATVTGLTWEVSSAETNPILRPPIPGCRAGGAPDFSLRVLDDAGQGWTSNVVTALEFARTNKKNLGIDINLSLGHPILEIAASDPLGPAVESASQAGIVVMCWVGNVGLNPLTNEPGYAGVTSPGNAPSAITVGAVDTQDTMARSDDIVAPYSSCGPSWLEARSRRARTCTRVARSEVLATVCAVSRLASSGERERRLPDSQWQQHGGCRHQRCCCTPPRGKP
jgi:hypothetical protein